MSQSQRPNPHKSGYFLASFVSQPLKLESRNAPRGNGEHCVTQVRAAARRLDIFETAITTVSFLDPLKNPTQYAFSKMSVFV